jgi:hypothetical protein
MFASSWNGKETSKMKKKKSELQFTTKWKLKTKTKNLTIQQTKSISLERDDLVFPWLLQTIIHLHILQGLKNETKPKKSLE